MSEVTKALLLDETGRAIADSIETLAGAFDSKNWASATDTKIMELISQADAGLIDLHNDLGWTEGDIRTVKLANDETVDLILTSPGHYELVTPTTGGKTMCNFVIVCNKVLGSGASLPNTSYVGWNAQGTNIMNNVVSEIYALFPSYLKTVFKDFYYYTTIFVSSTGSNTLSKDSGKVTIGSAKEITGSDSGSARVEDTVSSQLEYYKNAANRTKGEEYWTRTWNPTPQDISYINALGAETHIARGSYTYVYKNSPIFCI